MFEWQSCLQTLVAQARRIAIIGVGNTLHADDGAGQVLIHLLQEHLPGNPHLLLLDGGTAPENHTGKLRHFQPDLVLIVDAAWMDAEAGTIRLMEPEVIEGMSFSSHTLPLSMLTHYLRSELGCEVIIVGIQPATVREDQHLSGDVQRAVDKLAGVLSSLLQGFYTLE